VTIPPLEQVAQQQVRGGQRLQGDRGLLRHQGRGAHGGRTRHPIGGAESLRGLVQRFPSRWLTSTAGDPVVPVLITAVSFSFAH